MVSLQTPLLHCPVIAGPNGSNTLKVCAAPDPTFAVAGKPSSGRTNQNVSTILISAPGMGAQALVALITILTAKGRHTSRQWHRDDHRPGVQGDDMVVAPSMYESLAKLCNCILEEYDGMHLRACHPAAEEVGTTILRSRRFPLYLPSN